MKTKTSFAIESTLSGSTYLALIREAKSRGYRFLLHYIVISSGAQAVKRVALRAAARRPSCAGGRCAAPF